MKSKTQTALIFLAISSLATIGIVLAKGFLQNKPKELKKDMFENVLGEQFANLAITPANIGGNIQNFLEATLENTLQNTKETLSQKTTEVEKQIVERVTKELTSLSENQVKALKTQICIDLGVLPSGSQTPSPTSSSAY